MGLITKDCIHNRSTQAAHRRLTRTLVSPYVCVKVVRLSERVVSCVYLNS
jgi:hypothetical protein